MFQGQWKCSGCGKEITELPFEPKSTSGLLCKECHQKRRGAGSNGNQEGTPRKMFSGNWSCSNCNGAITELPFEPRETGNLLCKNCFKEKRQQTA